jgi:hypothetical protein
MSFFQLHDPKFYFEDVEDIVHFNKMPQLVYVFMGRKIEKFLLYQFGN